MRPVEDNKKKRVGQARRRGTGMVNHGVSDGCPVRRVALVGLEENSVGPYYQEEGMREKKNRSRTGKKKIEKKRN